MNATLLLSRPSDFLGPGHCCVSQLAVGEARVWLLIASSQSIYKSQDVVQVNIPAESGEMGVLANHVPSIEQLKPGLVEVFEESGGSKSFYRKSSLPTLGDFSFSWSLTGRRLVSGGFAIVQPGSLLSINAVEGYALEDFNADAVRAQITEAQKVASGNGSEQDIAEAKIELEVRASPCCSAVTFNTDRVVGLGEPAGCAEIDCIKGGPIDNVHQRFVSYI